MKIIFDFTAFLPQATGVDAYLKQLVLHLAKVDRDNQYLLCHNFEDRKLFVGNLPGNFSCHSVSARPRPVRLAYQQFLLPALSSAWGADVVHSPAFISPFIRGPSHHVLTIHDMTSFSHPQCHNTLRQSPLYLRLVRSSMKRADVLIAPSEATRKAILEFMPNLEPDRIHVTPLGIDDEFRPQDPTAVQEMANRLKIPQKYVLFVGTLEPRKNLTTLVESYRQLIKSGDFEEHLVLSGKPGWGYEELLELTNSPDLRGRVHLTGYVDQEDLPALYSGAKLFVYPSLLEGFGLPPLEAMACGVPTISSLSSSLTENLENAAILVPPENIPLLSRTMADLLRDPAQRQQLKARGLERARQYRWDETARQTLCVYQLALSTAR